MGKSTRRGQRGRADVFQVFSTPKQSKAWQIVSLLIRSRVELVMLALVVTVAVWLRGQVTPTTANVIILVVVVVLFVLPWSRRFLVARFWCVMDRHRLRACLRQTKIRTMNMDGSLPLMLWARPTKTGERVWLWVRAGSSGGDIEDALEYIAPACVARDARLHRVRKVTTLVAVEIIRRDPLGSSTPIPSPLAKLTRRWFSASSALEGTEPISPAPAPVYDITTLSAARTESGTPAFRSTKTAPKPAPMAAPVVVNGEDLSDYVD